MIDIFMKAAVSKNMHEEDFDKLHTFLCERINTTLRYIFDSLYSAEDGKIDSYPLESLFGTDYWSGASEMIIGNEADYQLSYLYSDNGPATDELVGDAFLCRKVLRLKDKIDGSSFYELDILEQLILYGTLDFWASECDSFLDYQKTFDDRNADREIIRYMLRTTYHMVPAKARVIADSIIFGEKMIALGKTKQSLIFEENPMQYYMSGILSHMSYLQKRFGQKYVTELFSGIASLSFPGRHKLDEYTDEEYDTSDEAPYFKVVS